MSGSGDDEHSTKHMRSNECSSGSDDEPSAKRSRSNECSSNCDDDEVFFVCDGKEVNLVSATVSDLKWEVSCADHLISIENARAHIPEGRNKFIVCLYISLNFENSKVWFLNINSSLETTTELRDIIYDHFVYSVPGQDFSKEGVVSFPDRGDPNLQYIVYHDELFILIGKLLKGDESYPNNVLGLSMFMNRSDPEKQKDLFPNV